MGSIVGPSMIFYITDMGGTLDQYGWMSAISSFSAFIMISVYGKWVDSNGNQYRKPYTITFILGVAGNLIYFLAIAMPKGFWAMSALMVSRFIGGMGGAGKTLAYSYVATVVPQENQKFVLTWLSSTRTFGQLLGPVANFLVAEIDTSISIGSFVIPVNPYNSVGLIMVLAELILWLAMFLLLKEPPIKEKSTLLDPTAAQPGQDKSGLGVVLKALTHFDIWFPLAQTLTIMFGFQLAMLGLAPITSHMFEWQPLQVSLLSTIGSVVMLSSMMITMHLSLKHVSDFSMLAFGNAIFVLGGALTYLWWRADTGTVPQVAITILLFYFGYPFMGPANRSAFTRALNNREDLAGSIGVLSGLYTQAFTLGGIIAPLLLTRFVFREPEEVDLSSNPHELTRWALLVPVLSSIIIVGLLYEEFILGKNESGLLKSQPDTSAEEGAVDETSNLVAKKQGRRRSSIADVNQAFSREYEVNRRLSSDTNALANGIVCMMNPVDTEYETGLRDELLRDKKEWEEIMKEASEDIEME